MVVRSYIAELDFQMIEQSSGLSNRLKMGRHKRCGSLGGEKESCRGYIYKVKVERAARRWKFMRDGTPHDSTLYSD
jgi:hypothetical protein